MSGVSYGLALALAAVGAVLEFLWARYSRSARTRTLVVVGTVAGVALLNLTLGLRLSLNAALDGRTFGFAEIVFLLIATAGALTGAVTGAALRARADGLP